ncbi:hypothetical protein [Estrella lausannensis]|uniref:Uncharacterized protein n=1 Tax=Estrella lausannensis TaxID=483423 RepID=A0A0H5E6H9_9BACT|nr:hypothetical protein [Estrella lausannensis]CRX38890.1 hypothetical protein ELAC_1562 [Estrella lausannensis]
MTISYDAQFIHAFKQTLDLAFSCPCHPFEVPFFFTWGTVLVSTTLNKTSEKLSEQISKVFADSQNGYVITPVQVDGKKATSKMTAQIFVIPEETEGHYSAAVSQIAKAVKEVCSLYNSRWNKRSFAYDGHDLSSHEIGGYVIRTSHEPKLDMEHVTSTLTKVKQIYSTV